MLIIASLLSSYPHPSSFPHSRDQYNLFARIINTSVGFFDLYCDPTRPPAPEQKRKSTCCTLVPCNFSSPTRRVIPKFTRRSKALLQHFGVLARRLFHYRSALLVTWVNSRSNLQVWNKEIFIFKNRVLFNASCWHTKVASGFMANRGIGRGNQVLPLKNWR